MHIFETLLLDMSKTKQVKQIIERLKCFDLCEKITMFALEEDEVFEDFITQPFYSEDKNKIVEITFTKITKDYRFSFKICTDSFEILFIEISSNNDQKFCCIYREINDVVLSFMLFDDEDKLVSIKIKQNTAYIDSEQVHPDCENQEMLFFKKIDSLFAETDKMNVILDMLGIKSIDYNDFKLVYDIDLEKDSNYQNSIINIPILINTYF